METYFKLIVAILGVIAAILGVIKAYIEYNKAKSKKEREDSILLNKKYTSLFAEDNKLKTEQIEITKQKNGEIEGTVTLVEKTGIDNPQTMTYKLKGRYCNKILTAEYFSSQDNVDERGAINLKLIDSNILSGFCSFSKVANADDEIRVSPYVWVSGENVNLIDGVFDFCTKCHEERKVCCCASDKIDMPVFLHNELGQIRNQLADRTTPKNNFSQSIAKPFNESPVRQMKRDIQKGSDGIEHSKCHFFDENEKRCQIYSGRPIDCKIFPYDIRKNNKTQEYVIGYYSALCNVNMPEPSIMKKKAHILRPYFFLLYPYLHIITSDQVCKQLNSAEFQTIGNFDDFVL